MVPTSGSGFKVQQGGCRWRLVPVSQGDVFPLGAGSHVSAGLELPSVLTSASSATSHPVSTDPHSVFLPFSDHVLLPSTSAYRYQSVISRLLLNTENAVENKSKLKEKPRTQSRPKQRCSGCREEHRGVQESHSLRVLRHQESSLSPRVGESASSLSLCTQIS